MVRSDARGRLDLAEIAFSVYYTTPDGRYRSRAYGTGTSGHAHYLMTEGQAYEQARELADLMNVSRVEIVQVRGSRHARAHIRRAPRSR